MIITITIITITIFCFPQFLILMNMKTNRSFAGSVSVNKSINQSRMICPVSAATIYCASMLSMHMLGMYTLVTAVLILLW